MALADRQQTEVLQPSGPGSAATHSRTLSDEEMSESLIEIIPHLRAFSRSLCKSHSLADDLVQDALLRAWTARHRFQAGTNFKAWMFVILRNGFLSRMRRQKFEQGTETADPSLRSVRPSQDGHMTLLEVREALQYLPPEQREVLLLVGAAEMTYDEAAKICGCMVGTIKSRLSRARTALQSIIDYGPPPGTSPNSKG